jgi:phosphoribosylglycinamide formyltransferase-1
MKQPLKLGFLASGNGSSAEAIVTAVSAGALAAEPVLMVSNRKDAAALTWARERGLDARHIATVPDPDAGDAALAEALTAANVDLVVLSGYLRRLGPRTQSAFVGRILNIHPGPLPQFGGEGMYGRRVHEAVLDAGLSETAIVIHLVDGDYDRGPELARRAVQVRTDDTAETLEDRVKAVEPEFFVETLQRLASGELALPNVG